MTSSNEYYPGRRVYLKSEPDSTVKIVVIRLAKKGVLCAIDDGTQKVFKQSEIEVYPRD